MTWGRPFGFPQVRAKPHRSEGESREKENFLLGPVSKGPYGG